MKKFHVNTTVSVFLSLASAGLSAYQYFFYPVFDVRLFASIASLLAFAAAFSEFVKYASHFQYFGLFLAMVTLGISVDHRLPFIPFMTLAMFFSFATLSHYVFRKWISETDFLFMNLFFTVSAAGLYVFANLYNGYGWKGWALTPLPILILSYFTFGSFMQGRASIKYQTKKKQNIEIGKSAPHFSLPDKDGKTVSLSDYKDKNHVLLVFIRNDWCPSCRIKLRTYEAHCDKFNKKNIQLLTISPGGTLDKSMTQNLGISFNILYDEKQEVCRNYGVQLPVEIVGEKNAPGMPLPASFLIDKNGIVRYTSRPDRIGEFLDPATIFPALEKLN